MCIRVFRKLKYYARFKVFQASTSKDLSHHHMIKTQSRDKSSFTTESLLEVVEKSSLTFTKRNFKSFIGTCFWKNRQSTESLLVLFTIGKNLITRYSHINLIRLRSFFTFQTLKTLQTTNV